MKSARQRRIVVLIRQQPITSQSQLARLLRAAGHGATQATVSRDLEELGAIKVRRGGKVVYALPTEAPMLPTDALRLLLAESITEVEHGGGLLVLKTPPGHAAMVASALDRSTVDGVAGTIAGDDTILVVCKPNVLPRRVERRLRSLIEGLPLPTKVTSEIGGRSLG